ncbi:MAG: potassium/proton antiporter [Chthoniobacterales bacterium]
MDTIYLVGSLILIAVVLAAVWLDRWSVPTILIALGTGIIFGSDVLKFWDFDNMELTNQIANLALIFILFFGGFSTKKANLKAAALPAIGLATWGVALTALASFCALHILFKWSFEEALLISVIVSSTDAAAIFSIMHRQPLEKKLSSTIEIESAANDPMAILLTLTAIGMLTTDNMSWLETGGSFLWQFCAAPILAYGIARAAIWLFNHLSPQDRGHYYVLTLGLIFLVYGLAQFIHSSGMLAIFVAGYVVGNRPFVHKQGVENFSAAFATIANIGMFVLLGLQVFPHEWDDIWQQGIVLFVVITFIARPFAVWVGSLGMRLGWRNKLFISWAGLRGAVPIVLATYPAMNGIGTGNKIFNLVFFAVLLSIAIQGSTLGWLARFLGLNTLPRPQPLFNLELITMAASDFDLIVVDLPGPANIPGPKISDLQLPKGATITLITRGRELVTPQGSTQLLGWDQVTVLAHAHEAARIRAILMEAFSDDSKNTEYKV